MFDTADMAQLFGSDMPGYAQALINAAPVDCLFRGPYQSQFGTIDSNQPSILCKALDVSGIGEGAAVTVRSKAYKVTHPEPDQTTDTVRLYLEAA